MPIDPAASRVGTPLTRAHAEQRAAQLRVLADPARLRLLSLVLTHPEGEVSMGELASHFEQERTTVSHHLRLLVDAGLLERERRSSWVIYRPTHHAVANFAGLVGVDVAEPAEVVTQSRWPNVAVWDHDMAGVNGQLSRISDQLATRFTGVFSTETVSRCVRESYAMLEARSRVRRFLPSLTAKFATERLSALAKAEGKITSPDPEVLFVCVRNAGRSQMAAAMLEQLAGDRIRVRSAGSMPTSAVDSTVITAMDEVGVHLGGAYPKPLSDEMVRGADIVITMGCGDACPVYPGKRYLDWPVPDPSGQPLAVVRTIRDSILANVSELARLLLTPRAAAPTLAQPSQLPGEDLP